MNEQKRWTPQGDGVYLERTGRYYHRPIINGKRTFRLLDVRTLTEARRLKATLDSNQTLHAYGLQKDPYAAAPATVGELIAEYRKAGCPQKNHQPRTGYQLGRTLSRLIFLETFWKDRRADQVKPKDCMGYLAARKTTVRKGSSGERSIDLELIVLSGVFHWAVFAGRLDVNPLVQRPRFRDGKKVEHCRIFMPKHGEELHSLARALFEDKRGEVLGWQLLLEAMTGCRTSEILRLRWDADNISKAGFSDGKHLWLNRSKGGINPWVEIHPALAETLQAMRQWRVWRGLADSPWFFPSPADRKLAVHNTSLTHALARVGPLIAQEHRTSHGLRAFYVTVRRSMGIADAQIAAEIGDSSGAAIIVSTYGAIPPNWQGGAGLSWEAQEPGWKVLAMPENILQLASG